MKIQQAELDHFCSSAYAVWSIQVTILSCQRKFSNNEFENWLWEAQLRFTSLLTEPFLLKCERYDQVVGEFHEGIHVGLHLFCV